MATLPDDLRYTKTHEWVKLEDGDIFTVGITDYAQSQLGDVVFVDLPELHAFIEAGAELAVVESVKTAADIYAALTGEIIAVNEALGDCPSLVNQDPYGQGWLYRIRSQDRSIFNGLWDAQGYRVQLQE